ncbi:MlaD family protein [Chlorogloeopsis sp. ULAP01]|uniref:MlaD family protein n=1 Tax=Chlorogloeopsis sp. ULAP01 TaxID=3056483 RepID=UPI0025AB1572|nr:MlaD family protein [Chlorogloeopsis sp. ULAP01]MDM9385596.1 MlaD family protein [Chlorogloeopsis sp. ULAP01]
MRSRTLREGSVGLLILVGLGVFGAIILWLNRFTAARSSYKVFVEFANAGGMQKGAAVRYRGVKVGNISAIRPGPNNVEVEIEIADPNLIIPRDVTVEANQSGLISESIVDITPKSPLTSQEVAAKPLDKNCDPSLIVCNGSRLKGQIGISLDELIRTTSRLAVLYTQPNFYGNANEALRNTSVAAAEVAQLSRDISNLTKSTQQQLSSFSNAANAVSDAADTISVSTSKTVAQFGTTAQEISATANQANQLLNNLNTLVTTNRSSLVTALNNITETSNQLRTTVGSLSPTVNRLTQGELLQNLETLSANAAQASANLRDATQALNTPSNLLVLQQTLDSARVTFENTQKITSDLDDITGDPALREKIKQLINGLSGLVSSTEQMQQQVKVASTLDAIQTDIKNPNVRLTAPEKSQHQLMFHISPPAMTSANKQLQPNVNFESLNSSQQKLLQQLRQYEKQRQQEELAK